MLERSFSEHSIEAYARDVNKLYEYSKDLEKSPGELVQEDITQFITVLHDFGISASSQARIISGIRAFYKYLQLEGMLDSDPTELVMGPKLKRKIPAVLTVEEIDELVAQIDMSSEQGHRNRAILETLYACGLRVSELIHLTLTNIHPDIGFIKVIGKNNKERIVPIGSSALKHIGLYLQHVRNKQKNIQKGHEDYVFLNRRGKALSRVMVFTIIKNLAEKAGIEKRISPHTFRHSFATHLVEGGANLRVVQDLLGHESISTTEIYTHLDQSFLRETLLNFHPRSHINQE
jgi:integrase/recombinase XerD